MPQSTDDDAHGAAPGPFSAEAVRRAQAGDERARHALFEAADPLLRRYFVSRIGGATGVDDLVQNTLLRLHEGLGDLKKPGSLKSFLMKAALYELQDYYRGRYDMKESLLDPEVPPEHGASDALAARLDGAGGASAQQSLDVERALAALSDRARRVIELREYGYRYKEIARMTGTTEAAIKMQVKRAFDKMRDVLATLGAALAAARALLGSSLDALFH